MGQFIIPSSYTQSKLRLLAYTRWMLNSDSTFLFHKEIPILSLPDHLNTSTIAIYETSARKQDNVISLQFFPEGGNMVTGILNKIAFKAMDISGNPVDVDGIIKNGKGDSVTSFCSTYDGMGFFYLTPAKEQSYSAQYSISRDSLENRTPIVLPKSAQSPGVNMNISLEHNNRKITIRRTKESPLTSLKLLATMNGLVDYLATVNIANKDSAIINIPTTDIPSGVLTITLLDDYWQPLCERITFICNQEEFKSSLEINIKQKDIKEKGHSIIELL